MSGGELLPVRRRPLVYNTAMYTVYGRCAQNGQCMVHTLAGVAGAWFIRR